LTTLRDGHVRVSGTTLRFTFRGKSGVEHDIDLNDPWLARIVKQCRDLPGYDLFQYYDERGQRQTVGSEEVNAYLKEITGQDFTSKDFRTWAGTVLAAQLLRECDDFKSEAQAKKNVIAAIEQVAGKLGNTKAVCRKCYIHPAVLESYMDRTLIRCMAQRGRRVVRSGALNECENAVLALLQRRNPGELKRAI
jgi:DNA topoisomerase-1